MIKAKVFADFNCLFCYVQHERFKASGLIDELEWCFIEHAPELECSANTPTQVNLLKEEHALTMKRADEVNSECPVFCVNTHWPILAAISVAIASPHLSHRFQSAICGDGECRWCFF